MREVNASEATSFLSPMTVLVEAEVRAGKGGEGGAFGRFVSDLATLFTGFSGFRTVSSGKCLQSSSRVTPRPRDRYRVIETETAPAA